MEREVTGGQEVLTPRIGAEQVRQAAEVLRKYRLGKQNLDRRIIDNEQFWKLRHWEQMEKGGEGGNPQDVRPASGWLVNCILSKHADAMDSYPEPTVLPREPGDRKEAEVLSRVLPVILKNNRFKKAYSQAWWNKLKSGCAVYGVFWDGGKLHGLGDIDIRSMDVLNLFWEPGVQSIQESEHFFSTELTPNRRLEEQYPELVGKLGRSGGQVSRYLYDDKVDTSEQSLVVDWYYHTVEQGRRVLQYCKFVGENVLYATENDPEMAGKGWYDHGQYPFVFDVLFPEEGTPCGYGYVDLCKSAQKQIDLMNQAILKNTLASATPRFFVRSDGAVNENEYADWTRPFVHTNGNLGADSIAPIRVPTLDSVYVAVLQNKIAEMKENYVAASDFGQYIATLSAYLEANPEALTQYYSFVSDLKTNVEAVDAAFSHYKVDTEGYIRTGIVYYEGAVPVYGVAVGQGLTCREVDGEKVVDQSNFRAVFTATRLSFWQDATEVAYVSNNRLYITSITVLGGIGIGQWSIGTAEDGLVFRWIGE